MRANAIRTGFYVALCAVPLFIAGCGAQTDGASASTATATITTATAFPPVAQRSTGMPSPSGQSPSPTVQTLATVEPNQLRSTASSTPGPEGQNVLPTTEAPVAKASSTPLPPAQPATALAPQQPTTQAARPQATANRPAPGTQQEALIRQLVPLAQAEQADSGVPASFSIALAAAETGWGVSPLMKQYNNYHMISCSKPNEGLPCVRYGDGLWNQYSSPQAAFLWQGRWMRAQNGFAEAFRHTDDVASFVRLAATCYVSCSGPFPQRFYDSTMEIINTYNLQQYDRPPASATP